MNFKVVQNRTTFCIIWPVNFLEEAPQKNFDLRYKIRPAGTTEQRAIFAGIGRRSSEIPWRNKKKTSVVKPKSAPKTIVSGRNNKRYNTKETYRHAHAADVTTDFSRTSAAFVAYFSCTLRMLLLIKTPLYWRLTECSRQTQFQSVSGYTLATADELFYARKQLDCFRTS